MHGRPSLRSHPLFCSVQKLAGAMSAKKTAQPVHLWSAFSNTIVRGNRTPKRRTPALLCPITASSAPHLIYPARLTRQKKVVLGSGRSPLFLRRQTISSPYRPYPRTAPDPTYLHTSNKWLLARPHTGHLGALCSSTNCDARSTAVLSRNLSGLDSTSR